MSAYEDGREYDTNDTLTANGKSYVVTGVSYQTDDGGNKINFSYIIRDKAEAEAEAEATRQAQVEAANQQEASTPDEVTPPAEELAKQAEDAKAGAVSTDEEAQAAHDNFDGELSTNEIPPSPTPHTVETKKEETPEAEPAEEKLPSLENNPTPPQS